MTGDGEGDGDGEGLGDGTLDGMGPRGSPDGQPTKALAWASLHAGPVCGALGQPSMANTPASRPPDGVHRAVNCARLSMSSAAVPVQLFDQLRFCDMMHVAHADASCQAAILHAHDRPVGVEVAYEAMAPTS